MSFQDFGMGPSAVLSESSRGTPGSLQYLYHDHAALLTAAHTRTMLKASLLSFVAFTAQVAHAAFGITTSSSAYVIDTNAPNQLKFTVSRSSCDITSIIHYGTELQYSSQGSHIGSGLGSATVTATQSGDYIKVTCVTDTLTQYMVVHNGDPIIHMATYITAG